MELTYLMWMMRGQSYMHLYMCVYIYIHVHVYMYVHVSPMYTWYGVWLMVYGVWCIVWFYGMVYIVVYGICAGLLRYGI